MRAFSCGKLVETARLRSFLFGGRFSASHVMRWMVPGMVCRAVGDGVGGLLACLYRLAPPLPLGAGDYVRPAGIVSVCGEGVGGVVEVLPISWPVVVSSHHLRRHCLSVCLLRCPRRHLPRAPCVSSSPLVPHVLRSRPHCSSCVRPASVFSCDFLSPLSPFFDKRGRGAWRIVICLLASFVLGCGSPVVRAFGLSSAADGGRRGRWRGSLLVSDGGGRCCVVGWLCLVCGWRVCIYELDACLCIMIVVERKRTRKDFDDDD